METIEIFIVECKTQKDEIITPGLLSYKVFGTMEAAQGHLDMIYNNVRQHKYATREKMRVEAKLEGAAQFPIQYWVIKEQYITK